MLQVLAETWKGRPDYNKISKVFTDQGGWVNKGVMSTSYCIKGRDCASNTLYVNTKYEAQCAALGIAL